MRFFAAALIFFGAAASYAQAPEVPPKIHFAGMTLTIRDDVRKEIQADVNALTRSPKYFNIKLERAKTYFPIIEKIFAEERVPDDFKFLVLQESALIADAVSTSDAVGFWQFKQETAVEMGMRVDKEIDERMNIVSATRGAAKYLKKSNYYFNNWLYALQSYQMGAGGVQRMVGDDHNGSKHVTITKDTYWYVKKYLAHKIAFESSLKGDPQLKVVDYQPEKAMTVKEIATLMSVQEEKLLEYNKWIKKGLVPDDRKYTVLVPSGEVSADFHKLWLNSKSTSNTVAATSHPSQKNVVAEKLTVNDVPVVRANPGETLAALAKRAQVDVTDFIRFNDISIDHHVKPGSLYFVAAKKLKGSAPIHQVRKGDDLWAVSQAYGVQMKKLLKYNRLESVTPLQTGTQLWLTGRKPKSKSPESYTEDVVEVSDETFEWSPVSVPVAQTVFSAEAESPTPEMTKISQAAEVTSAVESERDGTRYHEVKTSDTLYSVARQYGVTIKELMEWNNKTELSVSVGEKLRITPH